MKVTQTSSKGGRRHMNQEILSAPISAVSMGHRDDGGDVYFVTARDAVGRTFVVSLSSAEIFKILGASRLDALRRFSSPAAAGAWLKQLPTYLGIKT